MRSSPPPPDRAAVVALVFLLALLQPGAGPRRRLLVPERLEPPARVVLAVPENAPGVAAPEGIAFDGDHTFAWEYSHEGRQAVRPIFMASTLGGAVE